MKKIKISIRTGQYFRRRWTVAANNRFKATFSRISTIIEFHQMKSCDLQIFVVASEPSRADDVAHITQLFGAAIGSVLCKSTTSRLLRKNQKKFTALLG
jgi:hypothetical protein